MFRKTDNKLITRRTLERSTGEIRRPEYEQIDYILVQKRWMNGVKNVESEHIDLGSDHFPIQNMHKNYFKGNTS